jgi:hypothetical protein
VVRDPVFAATHAGARAAVVFGVHPLSAIAAGVDGLGQGEVKMTDFQIRMTQEIPMTNSKTDVRVAEANSSFELRHSLVIMVSSLVIFLN